MCAFLRLSSHLKCWNKSKTLYALRIINCVQFAFIAIRWDRNLLVSHVIIYPALIKRIFVVVYFFCRFIPKKRFIAMSLRNQQLITANIKTKNYAGDSCKCMNIYMLYLVKWFRFLLLHFFLPIQLYFAELSLVWSACKPKFDMAWDILLPTQKWD